MESNRIEIFNEDGTMKSKEEFLSDVEAAYDEMSKAANTLSTLPETYFGAITCPECQIDVESTLETFDFTERTIYLT